MFQLRYLLVSAGVLNLSWQRLQRAWWFLSLLLALVFVMGGTYAIAVEEEFPYVAVISLCALFAPSWPSVGTLSCKLSRPNSGRIVLQFYGCF